MTENITKNIKKMVIFDLDGTLWDSSEGVAESWNIEARQVTGRDWNFTASDICGVMGLTMNQIADRLMAELPPDERYALARRCEVFENEYLTTRGGRLYPGVRETLEQLHEAGIPMSIVSNCQANYVPAFLTSMDMKRYFTDYEEWGRTGLLKADNILLVMERNGIDQAVYVGDIQKDADASAEAGVPCIWAAYGFGHIENPAGTIETFDQLPKVLQELQILQLL